MPDKQLEETIDNLHSNEDTTISISRPAHATVAVDFLTDDMEINIAHGCCQLLELPTVDQINIEAVIKYLCNRYGGKND